MTKTRRSAAPVPGSATASGTRPTAGSTTPERPTEGGSYVRGRDGSLERTAFTRDADARDPATTVPADEAGATPPPPEA